MMMKMAAPTKLKTLSLYYDVISPYSWIAFEVLCRYRAKWSIDLKLKPSFLGGIMAGAENQPPGFVQRKAAYMHKDIPRLSKHYAVPLNLPENIGEVLFAKGSLPTMRFITAIDKHLPNKTEELSREFWKRVYVQHKDIIEPESLKEAAKSVGIEESAVSNALEAMKTPEIKGKLKDVTQEALNYGAFGVPTIIAKVDEKEHMIFGSDRFPILADIIGEKYDGPLTELSKL